MDKILELEESLKSEILQKEIFETICTYSPVLTAIRKDKPLALKHYIENDISFSEYYKELFEYTLRCKHYDIIFLIFKRVLSSDKDKIFDILLDEESVRLVSDPEILKFFISEGLDIHGKNNKLLITVCSAYNTSKTLKILLDKRGFSLETLNNAFAWAEYYRNKENMDLLLLYGAKPLCSIL